MSLLFLKEQPIKRNLFVSGLKCKSLNLWTHLQHYFIDSSSIGLKKERLIVMVAQISELKDCVTYKTEENTFDECDHTYQAFSVPSTHVQSCLWVMADLLRGDKYLATVTQVSTVYVKSRYSLGLLSSTRSQAQRWSESMEMGFCRIKNLILAFWLVTGSISTFSPEMPERTVVWQWMNSSCDDK